MDATGTRTLAEYVVEVQRGSGRGGELQRLMDEVLICETSFLRNPSQFDAFREDVLPELTARRPSGRLRFASVGCSSGEEPYSIASAALESSTGITTSRP